MDKIRISGNDILTIKNCLNYCKHRLREHVYCGLTKTGCQVEHIEKVLKNLLKPQEFNPQSMDARVWAKEFMRLYNDKHQAEPNELIDEGLMIGWFANAIMAGYDKAIRIYEPKPQEQVEIEPIGTMFNIIDKINELISVVNRLARKVK